MAACSQVDLDRLVGEWRGAFEAAQTALRANGRTFDPRELRERSRKLTEERLETMRLLEAYGREHGEHPLVSRLVASADESRRLLGLPEGLEACVFNLDGVLVGSAALHAEAWQETFDELFARRVERTRGSFAPFDPRTDYPRHIHARPRLEGVREFLASRGISLPDGTPGDPPGAETAHGLANRKNLALQRRLAEHGVRAYSGARHYLEVAHDAGLRCGVVSASANAEIMLRQADLTDVVDDRVDGTTMVTEHLRRKPAPDTLLAACDHLGVDPQHTAVFETTAEGVTAGRTGGFRLVVAVDRAGDAAALRARGADLVVADLDDILVHRLAA